MSLNEAHGNFAQVAYGAVTVETTGQNEPLLTGSLCSICISAAVCVAVRAPAEHLTGLPCAH